MRPPTSPAERECDQSIAVAIVDDHPSVVASIRAAVEAAPDMRVVATATSYEGALALLEAARPPMPPIRVLLLDIQLAGGAEGLRLLDRLTERSSIPGTVPSVVILSGFDQPSLIRAAFERGAAGYLVKTASIAEIVAAIRVVASGGTAFSATAIRSVRSALRRPSDREIQVIGLVSAGSSNAEAAGVLDLSEKTIESHLRRLFDRYGVFSRTELAVLAMREGWVSGTQPSP